MRKHKRIFAIGIAIMSLLLSGCGTPMYELTSEEEELIVRAAAYYVAKYNIYQKDGISRVYDDDETDSTVQNPSDSEDNSEGSSGENSTENSTENAGKDVTTMAAAAGMDNGLKVTYKSSEILAYVSEGAGYSVDAGAGFTFYVMTFEVKNPTEQDIEVDNTSAVPVFMLTSGTVKTKSSVSFLSTDFSTYQGTIKAGESIDMVLLFKVKEADAEMIKNPTLEITIDGATKKIDL